MVGRKGEDRKLWPWGLCGESRGMGFCLAWMGQTGVAGQRTQTPGRTKCPRTKNPTWQVAKPGDGEEAAEGVPHDRVVGAAPEVKHGLAGIVEEGDLRVGVWEGALRAWGCVARCGVVRCDVLPLRAHRWACGRAHIPIPEGRI